MADPMTPSKTPPPTDAALEEQLRALIGESGLVPGPRMTALVSAAAALGAAWAMEQSPYIVGVDEIDGVTTYVCMRREVDGTTTVIDTYERRARAASTGKR